MLVALERFIASLMIIHGNHPAVSTDGGTWYPQACGFLKLKYHIHSPFEKSIIIEGIIQHTKGRTEGFDDYFPCKKNNCKLKHVKQWLDLFIDQHDGEATS